MGGLLEEAPQACASWLSAGGLRGRQDGAGKARMGLRTGCGALGSALGLAYVMTSLSCERPWCSCLEFQFWKRKCVCV